MEVDMLTVALLAVELSFGVAFNWFMAVSERRGWSEGYLSLYAAVGVAVTLAVILPVLGWRNAALVAGAFTASGLPMAVGSIIRTIEARRREERAIIEALREAQDGDT